MRKIFFKGFLLGLLVSLIATCSAQSFQPHRGLPKEHNNQCSAIHNKKTIGQKLRNKVRYARKRHNNEMFTLRERRRIMNKRGL